MAAKTQGQLVATFGLRTAIILVVSSMIGSGIYKKTAVMAADLQSPGLVLGAWILAGLVSMLGVLTIGEIAGLEPGSGGPYAYLRRMYGRVAAFSYGWASITAIQSAAIASIAYVFAHSLNAVVTLPRLDATTEQWNLWGLFYPLDNLGVKLTAVVLILLLSIVNVRGAKWGGGLSGILTALVVSSLLLIIALGLSSSYGSIQNLSTPSKAYAGQSNGFLSNLSLLFKGMLSAFWAYDGWITLGFMAGEVKQSSRNLPRALIIGTLIVIVVYLLVNLTYLYILPIDTMIAVASDTNKIAAVEVIKVLFDNTGVFFLSLLIVVTTAACTNTTIMAAARIYQTMAAEGVFYPRATAVHPRYNTPHVALWLQCIISCLLVFSGTFDQLTDMLVFAQFIFYGAIAIGIILLRQREKNTPRPFKTPLYPVIPALYAAFCAFLVINTLYTSPRDAGFSLVLIAIGAPFYWWWGRFPMRR